MPNPKNGTLTDKPKQAVDKFSAAATVVKTEKKAPVIHLVIGQVSQPVKEIQANVEELVKLIDPPKNQKTDSKGHHGTRRQGKSLNPATPSPHHQNSRDQTKLFSITYSHRQHCYL